MNNNPLLTPFVKQKFSNISPEHIIKAIQSTLLDYSNIIEIVSSQSNPVNWNNLCQPLAEIDNSLNIIWSTIKNLHAVKNNLEIRKVYKDSLHLIFKHYTWLWQHKKLYNAYYNLRNSENYSQLSINQKKVVNNTIRDFKLSGINLSRSNKQRYGNIITRLAELSTLYSNNIIDATISWSKLITNKTILSGIPEHILDMAKNNALLHHNHNGWLLTLDYPCYKAIITYCDNVDLRKECYWVYNTRASNQGPHAKKWDNGPIINEILALRHELAILLGFKNYAYKSLITKMAHKPNKVFHFLFSLLNKIKSHGEREILQLSNFVKVNFGIEKIEPWDINYYSEKQKKHLFNITEEELRPYFPEHKVLNGLFKLVNHIYGITVKERHNVETWHSEVRFFDLFDEYGKLYGSFYLDIYNRPNKSSGAWMDECIGMMRKKDGSLQKPIAYLICNFNKPINNQSVLLMHNEIITLFHEFGHCLHHILTNIDTAGISGIRGVPWDVIELPSQLMEKFCWQPEILTWLSAHYETGKPLHSHLLNKLLKTKNYQIALFILRQLELSLFDLSIHYNYIPGKQEHILNIRNNIQKQVSVVPTVKWACFSYTFSHIFDGSYAAGYYSYLWSEVLAADAWSRFEKDGVLNRATGQSFLENILSRGGSEDPIILFTRFRSRKPIMEAFFRQYGLETN